jgi:hypothetical protein
MPAFTKTHRPAKPRGPSKVAQEFRVVVQKLLENNVGNVERWLREVAEGSKAKGVDPDPAKALDLITKLAEYAAPKLQRTEVTPGAGVNGAPPVTQIAITFVDGRAPAAQALPPVIDAPAKAVLDALPAKPMEPAKATRKRVRSADAKRA